MIRGGRQEYVLMPRGELNSEGGRAVERRAEFLETLDEDMPR